MLGWNKELVKNFRPIRLRRAALSSLAAMFLMLQFDGSVSAKPQVQEQAGARANQTYAEGIEALKKGDLAKARTKFSETLKLIPNNAEARNSLGFVLLLSSDIDPAIRELKEAVRLKPSFAQAHTNLSTALWRKKDAAEAFREAKEA